MARRKAVLAAALIALAAYAWAFATLMAERHNDISWFVVAGGAGVDKTRIPAGLSVIPGIGGYDGMAFYRLALDPFTRKTSDFGITLDNPAYRQQRVLYPLIVHLLSLGRAEFVPTLLVVVNLIAVVFLTIAAARLAVWYGLHPFWGLLASSYPGLFIAFSRDTSEVVAWAFAMTAIHAFAMNRWRATSALLCCAVLTRETTLVLALSLAALFAWELVRRRERSYPAITFVAPIVIYASWQTVLRSWWGVTALAAGAVNAAVPLSGFMRVFVAALSRHTALMRIHYAECVFWAAVVCAVVLMFRRTTAATPWRVAWLAYLALGSILAEDVWTEHISFMRVLSDLFAMSAVLLLGANAKVRAVVLFASCGLSYYVMSHMR